MPSRNLLLPDDTAPASASLTLASERAEALQTGAARSRETSLSRRQASAARLDTYAQPEGLARRLAKAELDLAAIKLQNQQLQLNTRRLVLALTEVSRRRSEAQHLAHHDGLTGLANRRLLETRLQTGLADARQRKLKLAMLFIDLDGFKGINDRYGHLAGDRLLVEVASRIAGAIRAEDIACRYGGDEFVVLLLNVDQVDVANMIADKIRERIGRNWFVDGHPIRVTASIGVAIYPIDGEQYDALMSCADASMYRSRSDRP